MKGIILAGGKGTRLKPLTKVTNKHLLPIYNEPMIFYPIKTLRDSGVTNIMIITGKESAGDFLNLLGSGEGLGVQLTYRIQDESGGIAEALSLCEDFVHREKVAVILGDNIFKSNFTGIFKTFEKENNNDLKALIFIKQIDDPERFGVVELDEDLKVVSIEEKPKQPKSSYAQTGLYLYDEIVFRLIKSLKPSNRGELEITDLNNLYLAGKGLKAHILDDFWMDAGTYTSLLSAGLHIKTLLNNK